MNNNSISEKPLLDYFNHLVPLSIEEQEIIQEKFHSRLYRKRQYVLQEGDVCKYFTFIVSGCLRMYSIDENGTLHIIQFATEGWWISDMGSFYKSRPSFMNIDAVEDTVVLQIKHDDLLSLYIEAPKFDRIFRVLIENSAISLQERLLQNISSNARVRYEYFIRQYPNLINRIPNTQIASFLGITPEFLSKIRNDKATK